MRIPPKLLTYSWWGGGGRPTYTGLPQTSPPPPHPHQTPQHFPITITKFMSHKHTYTHPLQIPNCSSSISAWELAPPQPFHVGVRTTASPSPPPHEPDQGISHVERERESPITILRQYFSLLFDYHLLLYHLSLSVFLIFILHYFYLHSLIASLSRALFPLSLCRLH